MSYKKPLNKVDRDHHSVSTWFAADSTSTESDNSPIRGTKIEGQGETAKQIFSLVGRFSTNSRP